MGALLVGNCPRCRSQNMTFDVPDAVPIGTQYGWQRWFEVFSLCRNCSRPSIFVLSQKSPDHNRFLDHHAPPAIAGSLNDYFEIDGFICIKDVGAVSPPEHVPEIIANSFREGSTSVVVGCPNAAGAMFRLTIDLVTHPLLPPEGEEPPGLNRRVRRDLGLRLPWLFANGLLPRELEDLSHCIREDGNDGAHAGTLTREDALDLQDFCAALLERLFTEPERLRLAAERRAKRRAPN